MPRVTDTDIQRMRDQLFFEGPEEGRRLSRFWILLVLAAVIAAAGVVADSTATVIGAMIVAPLMTPILGMMLAIVLADRLNLVRSITYVVAGAFARHRHRLPRRRRGRGPGRRRDNAQVGRPGRAAHHRSGGGTRDRRGRRVRPDPLRCLRHPARRRHRDLAGAAPCRGRPDPRIGGPRAGGRRPAPLRHQRQRHPRQRRRRDGASIDVYEHLPTPRRDDSLHQSEGCASARSSSWSSCVMVPLAAIIDARSAMRRSTR